MVAPQEAEHVTSGSGGSDGPGGTGGTGRRPRVAILVDNDVRRDSRVQKQARSMAEHGWEVRVLGLAPLGAEEQWHIGGAEVHLIKVETRRRPHEARSPRWRHPLAFPSPIREQQSRLSSQRRAADLTLAVGRARVRAAGRGRRLHRLQPWHLLPLRVLVKLAERLHATRRDATQEVRRKRRSQVDLVDRVATSFHVRFGGARAWRRLDSHLYDFDAHYGPAIDAFEPDVIHANDFRMLGSGARAKMRALMAGRHIALVWDAHEYLPGIKPWSPHPRWHVAQMAHENEFAGDADAVVTVSAELGEMLAERHHLSEQPAVVLNCPPDPAGSQTTPLPGPGIRELCGLAADTPLMVYSGSPSRQRGLGTVVEAMAQLPDVHCAFVVALPDSPPVVEVVERARELGLDDRLHLLPYVAPEHVVAYLSSADLGLIPIEHFPNHEIALITKFFEYSHARLPIVVSDVRAMSGQVRATGQGEVFTAGDVDDLARAVRAVVADPARYRAAYDGAVPLHEWTWESQAEILDAVYREALAKVRAAHA